MVSTCGNEAWMWSHSECTRALSERLKIVQDLIEGYAARKRDRCA